MIISECGVKKFKFLRPQGSDRPIWPNMYASRKLAIAKLAKWEKGL